jgi:hypothetical protein
MTGVELIGAALAAGAAAGRTNTTSSAIGDACTGLKNLLSRRARGVQVGAHNIQTNAFS